MLQKSFKAIQTERDMLFKKLENNKLIQDYSTDDDVSTFITTWIIYNGYTYYCSYYVGSRQLQYCVSRVLLTVYVSCNNYCYFLYSMVLNWRFTSHLHIIKNYSHSQQITILYIHCIWSKHNNIIVNDKTYKLLHIKIF